MRAAPADYSAFLEGICRDSDNRTAKFWRDYWLKTGHIRRLLQTLEKLDPLLESKPALLDVGSFGEFPLILLKYYQLPAVYANSLEGDFICYGQGKLLQVGSPDIEIALVIEQCDVERRPMTQADETLDVVTCFEVLEHLRYDPMFMMLEIHRVLRDGGLLVLSTPNAGSWESLARLAAFESPFIFSSYFADGSGIGHCKEYSAHEIRQLAENAGFRVEKLETFDSVPPNSELDLKMSALKDFMRPQSWWTEELRGQTFLMHARKITNPTMRKYYPLYTEDIRYNGKKKKTPDLDAEELRRQLDVQRDRAYELEVQVEELRKRLSGLAADFEQRTQWALKLDEEVKAQQKHVAELQIELDQRGRWALKLDEEINNQRQHLAELQTELDQRGKWAQGLDHELRLRDAQLKDLRFLMKQLWHVLRRS